MYKVVLVDKNGRERAVKGYFRPSELDDAEALADELSLCSGCLVPEIHKTDGSYLTYNAL